MICKKCGSDIPENQKFCGNCGESVTIENSVTNTQENYNEYEAKLAQANNAAELFLSSEKPTSYDYQIVTSLYGEVEKVGANRSKTYVCELQFYIKANLLSTAIFVTKIEQFEKVYDNLMKLALLNCKSEKEKEEIKEQFNKEEIIQKVNANISKNKILNTPKKKYAFYGFLLFIILIIITSIIVSSKNKSDNLKSNDKDISITPSNTTSTPSKSNVSDSVVIDCAKSAVSKTLKSSSTARWGTARIIDRDSYGKYLVYVPLEATNSFGGYGKVSMLAIVYDVTSDGHYKTNTYYGTQDITGSEKFVDTMDWSYIKEHNNWDVDPINGKFINNYTLNGGIVELRKDIEGKYYLKYNEQKIYSTTKATNTSEYTKDDSATTTFDNDTVILWWSGSAYSIVNDKLTVIKTLK